MSEFVPRLTLVQDVSPAAWLADTALEHGVAASLVPTGLEAYVQILHPAEAPSGDPMRWREVADWLHAPLLAGVWFQDLEELAGASPKGDSETPGAAPLWGEIPDQVLDLLKPVLARHTPSEHGWFCLWDGSGSITGSMSRPVAWPVARPPPPGTPSRFHSLPAFPPEILKGPKVRLPGRDYLLFEGPLEAAGELGAFVSWGPGGGRLGQLENPNWRAITSWASVR